MEFELIDNAVQGTIIKVVGVGGAGGNAVKYMMDHGVSGVEFIAANTDAQALARLQANNVIQIGESGLGAGAQPDVARKLAEASRQRIEDALRGAHMVFVTAGMGKGTGTGAAPIVAEVAKSLGALTVAVVTKPFSYEGEIRRRIAEEGIEELSKHVDSLIVILNEKLEEIYEDDSFQEWMQHADEILNNAVAGISEIINVPGYINVDFNDVKSIMAEQGKAMMGTAVASGVDRARLAAEQAVESPLLDGLDLSGARGVLINISATKNGLKGKEIKEILKTVRSYCAQDATVIQGVAFDDEMGDDLRVTVVATGLGKNKKPSLVPQKTVREATNNEVISDATSESQNKPITSIEELTKRATSESPAIWRNRTESTGKSVWRRGGDSAESAIKAMENSGMEPIDIPAFLRRQAD